MSSEFEGFDTTDTFTLSRRKPSESNILGLKWVYGWEVDASGTIVRAMARVVAKGFIQVEGVGYFDMFAPTLSASSIQILAALACKLD